MMPDRHVILSPEALDLPRQWWRVRSSPLFSEGIYGSLNARTTPPLPSYEFPEVTNNIFPTGVAAELTDPGIGRVASNVPSAASKAFSPDGTKRPSVGTGPTNPEKTTRRPNEFAPPREVAPKL